MISSSKLVLLNIDNPSNKTLNNEDVGTSEWDTAVTDLTIVLGTIVEGFESFVLGEASECSELNYLLGELVQ